MNEEFWKRFPPIPGFDCLKMKRNIQAKIYEEVKDLSSDERVAYFNRAGDELRWLGRIEARDAEPLPTKEESAPYAAKPGRKK